MTQILSRSLPRAGASAPPGPAGPASLEAREITAWFGSHQVLDRVSLTFTEDEFRAVQDLMRRASTAFFTDIRHESGRMH